MITLSMGGLETFANRQNAALLAPCHNQISRADAAFSGNSGGSFPSPAGIRNLSAKLMFLICSDRLLC
jgi:hypothetical protein